VYNTLIDKETALKKPISELREALLDLTGLLNRPQPDAALIALAGVNLDRALFPVLVRIERRGPLGIGELAELCGRDYTTISRQVATLVRLGLVARRTNEADARIKEAAVTAKGRAMARRLDAARQKLVGILLRDWNPNDVANLSRLLRRLADDALALSKRQDAAARRSAT
jgi:DNA-binding MarR family transcriptional regulator